MQSEMGMAALERLVERAEPRAELKAGAQARH
uniref:Uncharacterized protein n=1 Tax=Magnetospirillum gryphiswaldense TaxID=55518 RepID=A4TTQ2_9PROT|nr:hypothetical protein MGR_3004 [Magnetospirillum gryphiswaldense MSR-1]